jgi:hypothetical protein
MKRLLLAMLLSAAAPLVFGSDAPHVSRPQVANAENLINGELAAMYPDERYFILSPARGMFIDNFGLVFMAEINLVSVPAITPFHQEVTKQEIAQVRDRKLSRLPRLRSELLKILGNTTRMFQTPPEAGSVVLGITLVRFPWENTTGIPSQIVMQAQWSQLVEAQKNNTPLDSIVHVSEY